MDKKQLIKAISNLASDIIKDLEAILAEVEERGDEMPQEALSAIAQSLMVDFNEKCNREAARAMGED